MEKGSTCLEEVSPVTWMMLRCMIQKRNHGLFVISRSLMVCTTILRLCSLTKFEVQFTNGGFFKTVHLIFMHVYKFIPESLNDSAVFVSSKTKSHTFLAAKCVILIYLLYTFYVK